MHLILLEFSDLLKAFMQEHYFSLFIVSTISKIPLQFGTGKWNPENLFEA